MKDNVISYLDKIVEFLVEDTVVSHRGIRFFFVGTPYLCTLDRFNTHKGQIKIFFVIYTNNEYGVKYHHIVYIWERYYTIIDEKINSFGRPNCSITPTPLVG